MGGADTVFPFKSGGDLIYTPMGVKINHTIEKDVNGFIICASVITQFIKDYLFVNNIKIGSLGVTLSDIYVVDSMGGFGTGVVYVPYPLKKGDKITSTKDNYQFSVIY